MKRVFFMIAIIATLIVSCNGQNDLPLVKASHSIVEKSDQNDLVEKIKELMLTHYVFLDKAGLANQFLDKKLTENPLANFPVATLADSLTQWLQQATHDKHLRVVAPSKPANVLSPQEIKKAFIDNLSRYRPKMISGYNLMENNVSYVDIRFFGGNEDAFKNFDQIMNQLITSDALIIDMRKNVGGSPLGVQYLCSYFFDEKILLNTIYSRVEDKTNELWTLPVNGVKRPNIPLFILTSDQSFSGAEAFPYNLQALKRATVIGEVTKGGAHPTRYYELTNGFGIRIPFARAINPITKTNWEGRGVTPDVKTKASNALEEALKLANKAAIKHKENTYYSLDAKLNVIDSKGSVEFEQEVFEELNQMVKSQRLNEQEMNRLGTYYLQNQKIGAGLTVLRAMADSYQTSPNAFLHYGEGLATTSKALNNSMSKRLNEQAIVNFQKAVEIAIEQNHPDLPIFKEKLRAIEESNQ